MGRKTQGDVIILPGKRRNDVVSDYSFLSDLIMVTWRLYKHMC